MNKLMLLTNSKTTIAAVISAAASFILFAQSAQYVTLPPWVMALAAFAQIGGLAAFGIVAKDFNVTGGTTSQNAPTPPIDQKVSAGTRT